MDAARPPNRSMRLTFTVAGLWLVYFCAMAHAVPELTAFFCEIQVRRTLGLPALTRFIFGIPAFAWVLVGVLGAALIVGKSYALAPKAARIVHGAALAGLAAMIAANALWLYVPLRKLRLSF